jgi:hypothetical protein
VRKCKLTDKKQSTIIATSSNPLFSEHKLTRSGNYILVLDIEKENCQMNSGWINRSMSDQ